jgi:hypothetical protein
MGEKRHIIIMDYLRPHIIYPLFLLIIFTGCSKKKEPTLEEAISDKYEIQCAQLHRIACDFDSYWNGLLQGKTQDISILEKPEILTTRVFRDEQSGRASYIISGHANEKRGNCRNPNKPSVGKPCTNVWQYTYSGGIEKEVIVYTFIISEKDGKQLGYKITFDTSKMTPNFLKTISKAVREIIE